MAEDWLDKLLGDFQNAITRGTYEGLSLLDEGSRDTVMEAQARSCVKAYAELFDIPAELSLEDFLEKMAFGGSSKVNIERDGDTIIWEEEHNGECMCPLVKRGGVDLDSMLCSCAVHWLRMLVQRHTDRRVAVELIDSVANGAQNCSFRVRIGDGEGGDGGGEVAD
ncbi:MAG: hypothetical protein ACE5D3_06250 [Candidatus Binatia bacterium]